MKKVLNLLISLAIIFIYVCNTFSYGKVTSRWVKIGDNWRYELHEGTGDYITSKHREIYDKDGVNSKVYYFDYYGNMVTGPVLIDDELYVFADDGSAITTGYDIDGTHYETMGNGKVLGLPPFIDKTSYKRVATFGDDVNSNKSANTVFDDNNNILPTAKDENSDQ